MFHISFLVLLAMISVSLKVKGLPESKICMGSKLESTSKSDLLLKNCEWGKQNIILFMNFVNLFQDPSYYYLGVSIGKSRLKEIEPKIRTVLLEKEVLLKKDIINLWVVVSSLDSRIWEMVAFKGKISRRAENMFSVCMFLKYEISSVCWKSDLNIKKCGIYLLSF